MSAWIKMISDEEADTVLHDALEIARTPHRESDRTGDLLRVVSIGQ